MKIEKGFILNIVIGIVASGVLLFGLYTLYQDHKSLKDVVMFLNQQIQASQQAGQQAPPAQVPAE